MAWIGLVDEETQMVTVKSYAGEEQGYLSKIAITVSGNALSKGPTGRAIINKQCVFSQDIANDPCMKPWRNEALKRGFFSSAAVPIYENSRIIGAFTVYAPDIMMFDEHELRLIEEIGTDISFALDMIGHKEQRELAIEALCESEKQYRYLFENNPQPMWIYDLKTLSFLEVNQAAVSHYGYSREEFLRMTLKDIRPEEDLEALLLDVKNTYKDLNYSGEWRHKKKNGEIIMVEITSHTINFESKKTRLSLSVDVTERRNAESKLRTLSRVVEQNPASIIITDTKGNIKYVNPKFTQLTNYKIEEVLDKKPRIFKTGHTSAELFDNMWSTIKSGEVWQNEYLNRRKDKTEFWENVIISPLLDNKGEITNYIIISEDVSEKKKMMDDLVLAKKKAEESDHLKTAFLHNISHEIRTPMNAIVGFSLLLNESELSHDDCNRFTNIIIQSSNQLLSIITDIVNIATIEAGQERVREHEVNLNSLLALLLDQFLAKNQNQNIVLSYTPTLANNQSYIKSDETKLNEILSNLIGNALKFTREGSIQFGYTVKDNFLEFYVKDTGIGISVDMYEEIFKRFRQVDFFCERQFNGSGLGLSISKAYVELLGGRIWVESEPDKGSTFFFTIPYKQVIKE
jgi:PAS domain S-box-containing protein